MQIYIHWYSSQCGVHVHYFRRVYSVQRGTDFFTAMEDTRISKLKGGVDCLRTKHIERQ